ncbi:hypothetical protein KKE34_01165 [Patescibacteria group bacterium]|nr:hypothetical protein [Patescibacteria group bacterium]MBU1885198.1 hypothetical protein [Patescibacteria group bacterium]
MKKRIALLSVFYTLGKISQGLLLHPYQTMQSLVRDRVFVWMSFLPAIMFCVIALAWKYLILAFFSLVLPAFLIYLFIFFCFYWQALLCYLLVRFWVGFQER